VQGPFSLGATGKKALPTEQLQTLNAAVMQEEEDWLDWKAARELLENLLGLRQEVGGSRVSR